MCSYLIAAVLAVFAVACSDSEQSSTTLDAESERTSTTQALQDSLPELEGLQAEDFGIDPVLPEVVDIAVYGTFQEMADFVSAGGDLNVTDEHGSSAVMSVVGIDNGMLSLLLDHGANPDLRDDVGLAAINIAVIRRSPEPLRAESVKKLLAAGADTSVAATAGPWEGKTACDIARDQNDSELEQLVC